MNKLKAILVLMGLGAALQAQTCNTPIGSLSLSTFDGGSRGSWVLYTGFPGTPTPQPANYGGAGLFMDVTVDAPLALTRLELRVADDGTNGIPNQFGNTAPVNIWTCAGSRVGNELVPTAWTQIGTGTITVGSAYGDSTVNFATPVALPVGTYGMVFQLLPTIQANLALHPLWRGIAPVLGIGSYVAPSVQDQFLRVFNHAVSYDFLHVAPVSWPVLASIIRFTYQPPFGAAYFTSFGAGCYNRPPSWYELFPVTATPGTFDLSNSGIQCVPNGASYRVSQGIAAIRTPLSTSLTTTTPAVGDNDDGLYAAITLPWSFPYANGSTPGSTTQIMIGTNGVVFLSGTAAAANSFDSPIPWLNSLPNIALAYCDLDASGTSGAVGGIFYDVDPSNTKVYITYTNIPQYAPTPPSTGNVTAQLVLHSSGRIEMIYGTVTQSTVGGPIITGFTPGNGAADPGSRDLAIAGTFLPFNSGDGAVPARLTMDARPVLGTTPNLVTSGVEPTTQLTLLVFGLVAVTSSPDLAGLGMPGCFQYVQPASTNGALFNAGVANSPLAIPNSPSLAGVSILVQSVPFQTGNNPAGILTSNALCLLVGT